MNTVAQPAAAGPAVPSGGRRGGLAGLFFWLLWGDFVLVLMETVELRVLPLQLRSSHLSDTEIAFITVTLASVMNAIINPLVSYRSDRTRTRWGRRIPYLAAATVPCALALALIPWSPELAAVLGRRLPWAPHLLLVLIFGATVFSYVVFNMVIGSVYYYLLPDVVPGAVYGRFTLLTRIVSTLAAFVFNYWLLGLSERWAKELFAAVAVLYASGFLLMCWRVREPALPVPAPAPGGTGGLAMVRDYLATCTARAEYGWLFLLRAAVIASGVAGTFAIFFARDQLGLTLDQVGRITAWSLLPALPIALPFGWLLDRGDYLRIYAWLLGLLAAGNVAAFALVDGVSSFTVTSLLLSTLSFLLNGAWLYTVARIFPRERLGQLSSAAALVGSLAGAVLGPVCGWLTGRTGDYSIIYLWSSAFLLVALAAALRIRRAVQRPREQAAEPASGQSCQADCVLA